MALTIWASCDAKKAIAMLGQCRFAEHLLI